jgi:hypothetical protein
MVVLLVVFCVCVCVCFVWFFFCFFFTCFVDTMFLATMFLLMAVVAEAQLSIFDNVATPRLQHFQQFCFVQIGPPSHRGCPSNQPSKFWARVQLTVPTCAKAVQITVFDGSGNAPEAGLKSDIPEASGNKTSLIFAVEYWDLPFLLYVGWEFGCVGAESSPHPMVSYVFGGASRTLFGSIVSALSHVIFSSRKVFDDPQCSAVVVPGEKC